MWHDQPFVSMTEARHWAGTTTTRLPAVHVVATAVRPGGVLVVHRDRELLAAGPEDAALVGSAIHSCVVRGVALDGLRRLEIVAGAASATVRFTGSRRVSAPRGSG